MAKQLFKGFKQVLSGGTFENGYLYFVREDETKEHGYLYFNGKKYGTTKEVYEAIAALEAISADTRLEALETALSSLTEVVIDNEEVVAEALNVLNEGLNNEISARTADDVADVMYDSSAKTIYIKYNDGSVSEGFDASAFIVDGMLSSVTYDSSAHTITFIWNTDAGSKEITIDLDDIIAAYQADETTIHLGANNTFSAIMDQPGGVASYSALTAEEQARIAADEALSGNIEELKSDVEALSGDVEELKSDVEALSGDVEELKSDVDTLSGDVEELKSDLAAEVSARTAADEALSGNIIDLKSDIEALSGGVEELKSDLAAEVSARTAADEALSGGVEQLKSDLAAEVSARTAADEALSGNVNDLKSDVETLSGDVEELKSDVNVLSGGVEQLKSDLAAEISARTAEDVADIIYDSSAKTIYIKYNDGSVSEGFSAADFIIDGMLSSVTYDVSAHTITFIWNTDAGGKKITVNLDDIISPYQADETTIHLGANNTFSAIMDQPGGVASYSALTDEVSARTAADEALSNRIDQLQSGLAAEEMARADADRTINARIDTLSGNVSDLESGLAAEVSARTEADEELANDIETLSGNVNDLKSDVETLSGDVEELKSDLAAEVSARTAADEALSGDVEELKSDVEALSGDVIDLKSDVDTLSGDVEELSAITADLEEGLSALTEEVIRNEKVTAASLNDLNRRIIELDGTKLPVGEDIPSGTTSGTTITDTLADIYEKLSHAAQLFTIQSSDKSLVVSGDTQNFDLTLNRETATNDTVAAGHIEIALNASGETYAVMYYDGNDIE